MSVALNESLQMRVMCRAAGSAQERADHLAERGVEDRFVLAWERLAASFYDLAWIPHVPVPHCSTCGAWSPSGCVCPF